MREDQNRSQTWTMKEQENKVFDKNHEGQMDTEMNCQPPSHYIEEIRNENDERGYIYHNHSQDTTKSIE